MSQICYNFYYNSINDHMGVQATKHANTNDECQNIVFKRTAGSFHNLNSPRDIHKDFIWKKWKFSNLPQSEEMLAKLNHKLGHPHPHIISVKDMQFTKTNKQIYKIRAKIEFSQRNLKNQIEIKRSQYKYFCTTELWKAVDQLCQIALYAQKNNIEISQNLCSYLVFGNTMKMKDPDLLPEIKSQKNRNVHYSKIICRIISNLALLTTSQQIVNLMEINRINIYYNVYLATFIFFLKEDNLTVGEFTKLSKKLQQQNNSQPLYKTPKFILKTDNTANPNTIGNESQPEQKKEEKKCIEIKLNPISQKLIKKSTSQQTLSKKFSKRIQQIKPKDLRQINKSIKDTIHEKNYKKEYLDKQNIENYHNKQNQDQNVQSNKQNNYQLNNKDSRQVCNCVEILEQDHYFPKKIRQFLRTSSTDTEGNSSKNIDMKSSEARNQAFMKITGGSCCDLFGQDQNQQLLQSIIESEQSIIIHNSESPLFSIEQQIQLINQDFFKLQNAMGSAQRDEAKSIIEFGYQRNQTIIELTQQNQQSEQVECIQRSGDVKSSIVKYNQSHISQFQLQEQEQKYEEKFVIEQYEGGSRYEGYIFRGLRNGFGKLYYEDGGSYEGSWKNGEIQGFGKLYYQSGDLAYEGYWFKGQFHGQGKIINENPDQIDGEFNFRDFTDIGISWIEYEGNFQHDHKNGRGYLLLSNGQRFSGHWSRNNVQGKGQFVTLSNKIIRGVWRNNILIQIQQEKQADDQNFNFQQ